MRRTAVPFVIALSLLMATAASAVVTHVAYAQCGPNNQYPCPPAPDKENKDKKAKPTATDVPTPTDTPTSEPPPVIIQTVVVTPDAKQLALMCAGLPGSPNGGTGPNAGNPEPNAPRILPFMDSLGGQIIGVLIGLLTGILIGLLLPAVLRGQRLSPGGIIAVNRKGQGADGILGPSSAGLIGSGGAGGIIGPTDSGAAGAHGSALDNQTANALQEGMDAHSRSGEIAGNTLKKGSDASDAVGRNLK
jgi:hypothetical protein